MAQSTLTVRTLCLATVALILACGHAARAMGQQKAPDKVPAKVVPPANRAIRVVPAGSGQSTIATVTAKSGGAGRVGTSKVATFTNKSSTGGSSIVTFGGDRVLRDPSHGRTRAQPVGTKQRHLASTLGRKSERPVIAVRRPGDNEPPVPDAPWLQPVALAVAAAPTAEPVSTETKPVSAAETRPEIRNAFAGLSTPSVEPRRTPPILSIQASAAR
jgi:hypothetical protein